MCSQWRICHPWNVEFWELRILWLSIPSKLATWHLSRCRPTNSQAAPGSIRSSYPSACWRVSPHHIQTSNGLEFALKATSPHRRVENISLFNICTVPSSFPVKGFMCLEFTLYFPCIFHCLQNGLALFFVLFTKKRLTKIWKNIFLSPLNNYELSFLYSIHVSLQYRLLSFI